MYCPKCGNELAEGTKFCGKCGSSITQAAMPASQGTSDLYVRTAGDAAQAARSSYGPTASGQAGVTPGQTGRVAFEGLSGVVTNATTRGAAGNLNYASNRRYIRDKNLRDPLALIILGLLPRLFTPFFFTELIIVGVVWLAFQFVGVISDEEYDANVRSGTYGIRERALGKLGLDEEEVQEIEPITIDGYKFADARYLRKGADGIWRTNVYEVATLFFTKNEVQCYKYAFSTINDYHQESTDIFFYQDIVSVSTLDVPVQYNKRGFIAELIRKLFGWRRAKWVNYKAVSLCTAGGNSFEAVIRDVDNVQRSINAMRQLLRQKKS